MSIDNLNCDQDTFLETVGGNCVFSLNEYFKSKKPRLKGSPTKFVLSKKYHENSRPRAIFKHSLFIYLFSGVEEKDAVIA